MWPLKVGGIALASAISATVNYLMLYNILQKKVGGLDGGLRQYFIKILFAAALMCLLLLLSWNNLFLHCSLILRFVIAVSIGLVGFIAFCFWLKVKEIKELALWILNRK